MSEQVAFPGNLKQLLIEMLVDPSDLMGLGRQFFADGPERES